MNNLFNPFIKALQEHDKETAIKICETALAEKKVDLVTLYEDILAPALNHMTDEFEDKGDQQLLVLSEIETAEQIFDKKGQLSAIETQVNDVFRADEIAPENGYKK